MRIALLWGIALTCRAYILPICLGLLCGCSVVNRPYYKLSAPGGALTRETSAFVVLDIPLADDLKLSVLSLCNAIPGPSMAAGDPCDIWVYAFGSAADEFKFESMQFSVHSIEPPEMPMAADASHPDFGVPPPSPGGSRTWPAKAFVDLEYSGAPQQFLLNVPRIFVGDRSYMPPPVTFSYEENVDVQFYF